MNTARSCAGLLSLAVLVSGCAGDPCALFGDDYDFDRDGWVCSEDCVDFSPDIHPGAFEACDGWDTDCDGIVPEGEFDLDGDGYLLCGGDCGPTLFQVHPQADEFCDGHDNDCNPNTPLFPGELVDADSDGSPSCADCDDQDPYVWPGQVEDCDGEDTDCNGVADAGAVRRHLPISEGADGTIMGTLALNSFTALESVALTGFAQRISSVGTNWNPEAPRLTVLLRDPAASEWNEIASAPLQAPVSGDWWRSGDLSVPLQAGLSYKIGVAASGAMIWGPVDTPPAPMTVPFGEFGPQAVIFGPDDLSAVPYADLMHYAGRFAQSWVWRGESEIDQDGDGALQCADCDDAGAEICDGFDFGCDGQLAPGESDDDLDGFLPCISDCDDNLDLGSPNGVEVCDGFDGNCLAEGVDSEEGDVDGDGQSPCEGDCDDADAASFPGAPEQCDSIDQDCDGDTEDWRIDLDGDGVWSCFDCDDEDETRAPGLPEECDDNIDQDCDGVDATSSDPDSDGVSACDGDCAPLNWYVHPGAVDVDDGLDNDCDGDVDELVPSVRVDWAELEVVTMEAFWGPQGVRRPRLGGDFFALTRSASGEVVDIEALDLDPLIFDTEHDFPPTWSDMHGSLRMEGAVWLEAAGAVQLVIASLDPYVELDVRLLAPPPAHPADTSASRAASPQDCEDLRTLASASAALDEMHATLFPWIVFNEPTGYSAWDLIPPVLGCDPASSTPNCHFLPTMDLAVGVCKGLAASAPAVSASVTRVDWAYLPGAAAGLSQSGGRIVIDAGDLDFVNEGILTAAHEAAHAYTFMLQGSSPLPADPSALALTKAALAREVDFDRTHIAMAFASLASSANTVARSTRRAPGRRRTSGWRPRP